MSKLDTTAMSPADNNLPISGVTIVGNSTNEVEIQDRKFNEQPSFQIY